MFFHEKQSHLLQQYNDAGKKLTVFNHTDSFGTKSGSKTGST